MVWRFGILPAEGWGRQQAGSGRWVLVWGKFTSCGVSAGLNTGHSGTLACPAVGLGGDGRRKPHAGLLGEPPQPWAITFISFPL